MNNIIERLKELYKKDKKTVLIAVVFLVAAVILLFIPTEEKQENEHFDTQTESTVTVTTEEELEDRLCKLVENINGAGKARVMISLESTGEYIYAENCKYENDGNEVYRDSEIVLYETENGNDEGLLVSTKNPEISGVAVICEGGDSSVIKAEIINLVTSLFGIGADRVYVGRTAGN